MTAGIVALNSVTWAGIVAAYQEREAAEQAAWAEWLFAVEAGDRAGQLLRELHGASRPTTDP